MRILHTSDWHLGRILYNVHLEDDQQHLLVQIRDMIRDAKPDVLVIAGDVYDRAVPSAEAVLLLDEFLAAISLDHQLPVVMIAGNHDSAKRLGFAARILSRNGLHIAGSWSPVLTPIPFEDDAGPVDLVPIPYLDPPELRGLLDDPEIRDHEAAMRAALNVTRSRCRKKARKVGIVHAFLAGGTTTESERPLSIGGAESVPEYLFEGFDYVALGHLHRPQNVGSQRVRYSGSLMKYSFSEADHTKSASLVEIGGDGAVSVETLPYTPRHDLRILEGPFNELLERAKDDPAPEDYLLFRLTNREPIFDAMNRLREGYPNVLHVEYTGLEARLYGRMAEIKDFRRTTETDLFAAFVRDTTGEEWTDVEKALFASVVEDLARSEREVL